MNRAQLIQDLVRDEGLAKRPYVDSVGKTTIGVGRNLDDVGLSDDEVMVLAANDLDRVEAELDRNVPWWREMPEARQRALANMAFNLGWPRLSGFRRMLGHLKSGAPEAAAREALDSKWAVQVGDRAGRIAELIRKG